MSIAVRLVAGLWLVAIAMHVGISAVERLLQWPSTYKAGVPWN